MPAWRRDGDVIDTTAAMAVLLVGLGQCGDAARLGAASLAHEARGLVGWDPLHRRATARWQALLAAAGCDATDLARWQREGQRLDEAAIEVMGLRAVTLAGDTQPAARLACNGDGRIARGLSPRLPPSSPPSHSPSCSPKQPSRKPT